MHAACENGHPEVVEVLLNVAGIDVNLYPDRLICALDVRGASPQQKTGKLECARLLLNHEDINVMVHGEYNATPLQIAVASQVPVDIIEQLLHKNCDFWSTDLHGFSTIYRAVESQSFDLFCLLRDHEAKVGKKTDPTSLLFLAVKGEDQRFIEELIKDGADVHATETDVRETAIFKAAASNRDSSIRTLVSHGASVNIENAYGVTPLMIAANEICLLSAKALIWGGAAINFTTRRGKTLFEFMNFKSEILDVIKDTLRDARGHEAAQEFVNRAVGHSARVADRVLA